MKTSEYKSTRITAGIKSRDINRSDKSAAVKRFESSFVVKMISATPVTSERLRIADVRASRARDARDAGFLEQYKAKA